MAHITARRTVASLVTRALSSSSPTSVSSPSRFAYALIDKIPLPHLLPNPVRIPVRPKTSGSGYSPLNDPSPNWSNRPPKETILLDGCDYEHWLIVLEFNDPQPNEEEMINTYVKTLAQVLGSEEEAKKKIYSVCTTTYTGFGALISEELSHKVKGLPGVLWVLPDSYLDVPNKDYGGDLFIDGKVIHRPQYWYNQSQPARNRSRPRYDRRRETRSVEWRHPKQTQDQNQDQRQPPQQSSSMAGQNPSHGGTSNSSVNQGGFNNQNNV